jgi:hypothetical protein
VFVLYAYSNRVNTSICSVRTESVEFIASSSSSVVLVLFVCLKSESTFSNAEGKESTLSTHIRAQKIHIVEVSKLHNYIRISSSFKSLNNVCFITNVDSRYYF